MCELPDVTCQTTGCYVRCPTLNETLESDYLSVFTSLSDSNSVFFLKQTPIHCCDTKCGVLRSVQSIKRFIRKMSFLTCPKEQQVICINLKFTLSAINIYPVQNVNKNLN